MAQALSLNVASSFTPRAQSARAQCLTDGLHHLDHSEKDLGYLLQNEAA